MLKFIVGEILKSDCSFIPTIKEDNKITIEEYLNLPQTQKITPFDPNTGAKYWKKAKPEQWDDLVPIGFLSDYILHSRGYETPTKFGVWAGIWMLSRLIGRDAWLPWAHDKLFFNFYVLLVAEAAIARKSTSINLPAKILKLINKYLPEQIAYEKETPTLMGKGSEASLYMLGEVKPMQVELPSGELKEIKRNANIAIVASELATLLGRESYKSGLTNKLTALYDCEDDDNEATRSRNVSELENIYCTFLGGTTLYGYSKSLPEEALAEGFGSRLTIVFVNELTRKFFEPRIIPGIPDRDELAKRLTWISANARGPYTFTKEANDFRREWYTKWKEDLVNRPNIGAMRNRMDIQLYKLSALLRAQEYRPGRVIELRHVQLAERMLNETIETGIRLNVQISGEARNSGSEKLYALLSKPMNREFIMKNHNLKAKQLNIWAKELIEEGKLLITDPDTKKEYTNALPARHKLNHVYEAI